MKNLVKILILGLILLPACKERCFKWNRPLLVEDNRACQAARAGENLNSGSRYRDCLESLGYYTYEVECAK